MVVDLKALYDTLAGTAANTRASIVYNRARWTPNGDALVAANGTTSGEGLHDGIVGQEITKGLIHGASRAAFAGVGTRIYSKPGRGGRSR